jgi:hypothetical protein
MAVVEGGDTAAAAVTAASVTAVLIAQFTPV